MKVRHYGELHVWRKAMDLAVMSYRVTVSFPTSERYGLIAQVRRAAASIPANIAEGHGREHLREYVQHLSIANGSLMELETHLILARRLDYVSEEGLAALLECTSELGKMLAGLTRALKHRLPSRHLTPGT